MPSLTIYEINQMTDYKLWDHADEIAILSYTVSAEDAERIKTLGKRPICEPFEAEDRMFLRSVIIAACEAGEYSVH